MIGLTKVGLSSISSGQNQPVYSVRDFPLMEIDEQSDGDVQQFHVAQQLRLVDWQHFFYGLGFHEHAAFHQQIKAQRLFPREAFVFDRHEFLADTLQPAKFQFFL
jgi:hypothetical protein